MRDRLWIGKTIGLFPESLTYFRIEKDFVLMRIKNHGLAAVLEEEDDIIFSSQPDLVPNVKIYVSKKELETLKKNMSRLHKKSMDLLDKAFENGNEK